MHALELGSSRPASVVSEKVAGDGGRGHSAGVGGGGRSGKRPRPAGRLPEVGQRQAVGFQEPRMATSNKRPRPNVFFYHHKLVAKSVLWMH